MTELKPCLLCGSDSICKINCDGVTTEPDTACCNNCGCQASLDAWNNRPAESKIKADAVIEFLGEIKSAYKPPRLSPTKLEYYKAAIRHVLQAGEVYANKLEQGE